MNDFLSPADYEEPRCPFCSGPEEEAAIAQRVPQDRIMRKLDEYMARRDYEGARRHLDYWLREAQTGRDMRGELLVRNEMIGFYRKTGKKDEAYENAEAAIRLLDALDLTDSITAGTTYTNAATACNTFGDDERALAYFEKARAIYERAKETPPHLLGGLYNNMGLTCAALKRFDEAAALYEKALRLMETVPNGKPEQAITCLNLANAIEAQKGAQQAEKEIFELLDRAYDLLNDPQTPRDGYYAFVCASCAPTFSYYGYFAAAAQLNERAKQIS